MRTKRIVIMACLVLLSITQHAQENDYLLTLEQAKEYALQHNKTLLNARDNLSISDQQVRATVARGLPQIDGGIDFMTYFNYKMEFNFSGGDGTQTDIDYTKLDEGDLEILKSLSDMMGGSSTGIILNNQMSGNVQVSQLLFSGQYWAGVQTAKIARELARQNVRSSELDVVEGITNSYYMTLIIEKNLDIIRKNIENLNTVQQHTNNLYQAGVAELTDVDQIRVAVNQLKNAQKTMERTLQLNYNMLRFQLGVSPDARIVLAENIDQIIGSLQPISFVNKYDVTGNINYQLISSQVNLTKKQLDLQNWAYAPTLAGFYSYTKKIITTGFDMTPNHLAGFSLTVPVFSSGMRRAQVKQARINLDIARRNQELVKEQLETQERQLIFNYQNAQENFDLQQENVRVAERVYESIQNKYKQGLVSSLDLTQANSNYLSAESNYFSAVMTLLQAQTSLNKMYNTLF